MIESIERRCTPKTMQLPNTKIPLNTGGEGVYGENKNSRRYKIHTHTHMHIVESVVREKKPLILLIITTHYSPSNKTLNLRVVCVCIVISVFQDSRWTSSIAVDTTSNC